MPDENYAIVVAAAAALILASICPVPTASPIRVEILRNVTPLPFPNPSTVAAAALLRSAPPLRQDLLEILNEKNSYSTLAQESDQEGDRDANWDRGSAFSFYNSNPDSDSTSTGDSSSSFAWRIYCLDTRESSGGSGPRLCIGKYMRKKREQQSAVRRSTLEGLVWLASINTVHSALYSSAAASAPHFTPTCRKKY
ncbi:hypothetical protein OROHE_010982 [Orobanche hederae]